MNFHTIAQAAHARFKRSLLYFGFTLAIAALVLSSCNQSQSVLPFGITSEASYAAPKLGVVVDEKMVVVDLDAGGPAEKAGIQKGDVLISIDGVAFTDKEKADAVIQEFPGEAAYEALAKDNVWQGKTRRLELQRNDQIIEVEVVPAPLTWWGLSPTPTEMSPSEPLDYL